MVNTIKTVNGKMLLTFRDGWRYGDSHGLVEKGK